MMKTVFAYLDNQIAPVFDTTGLIHVLEVESDRVVAGEKVCDARECMQQGIRR
jgi:hypothetical protein